MFDVAIVGGGSAGCVLANRLSAEAKRKVVLIEAGPPKHGALYVRAPMLYQKLWHGKLCWNYKTVPQEHVDRREMYWPRGKVIGGSNSFNAMVYIRGHRDNYDEWRDLGNPGWGYDDVLPYFKKSEDNSRGASEFHGTGGELAVHDVEQHPITRAFIDATAARAHLPVIDDFNGASQEGVGFSQVNIRGGLRASAATQFLDPIRSRDNLTVITDALACGLVLDGDRCTGVKIRVNKTEQVIEAREVIVRRCDRLAAAAHALGDRRRHRARRGGDRAASRARRRRQAPRGSPVGVPRVSHQTGRDHGAHPARHRVGVGEAPDEAHRRSRGRPDRSARILETPDRRAAPDQPDPLRALGRATEEHRYEVQGPVRPVHHDHAGPDLSP